MTMKAPKPLKPKDTPPTEAGTAGPSPGILTLTSPTHLELVRVPAGEFLMGSVATRDESAQEDEFPQHRVYLPEFLSGRYPITNQQYAAFVDATGSAVPQSWVEGGMPPGKENHPVVTVLWSEALAFCNWLGEETGREFHLPTEAEWEKAARGTDGRIYPWGDGPPDERLCNYERKVGDTTPVGRYSPQGDSPYGCADMAGNVWEWCRTKYRPYPYRAGDGREDLRADGGLQGLRAYDRRVVRGGAFIYGERDVRCAVRFRSNPNHWDWHGGFRVVLATDGRPET